MANLNRVVLKRTNPKPLNLKPTLQVFNLKQALNVSEAGGGLKVAIFVPGLRVHRV